MTRDWSRWTAIYGGGDEKVMVDRKPRKEAPTALLSAPPKKLANGGSQVIRIDNAAAWPTKTERGRPDGRSAINVIWFCAEVSDPPINAMFNAFDQRTYVLIDDEQKQLDDTVLREVVCRMHEAGCIVSKSIVDDAIHRLGSQNSFHPVRDYLDSLEWDGKSRLQRLLPHYLNAEDTLLNRAFGRAWMISAVRRIRQPGCKVDAILTLQSPQGTGKSAFFRILASDAWFNDSLEIGGSAKDVIENATGAWIIELAELSSLGKREVEEVKKFASIQSDRARTAWARVASEVPRQFVFGATVNREEFLIDDTGNRRFWVAQVGRTLEKELARDRDQLWAEAAHLEAEEEAHNIPEALWPDAAKVAEQHTFADPIAEGVVEELGKLPKENVVVTAADIYRAIGVTDITRQSGPVGRSVAAGARRAGWQSKLMRPPGAKTAGSVRCYHSQRTDIRPRTYAYDAIKGFWKPVIVKAM